MTVTCHSLRLTSPYNTVDNRVQLYNANSTGYAARCLDHTYRILATAIADTRARGRYGEKYYTPKFNGCARYLGGLSCRFLMSLHTYLQLLATSSPSYLSEAICVLWKGLGSGMSRLCNGENKSRLGFLCPRCVL